MHEDDRRERVLFLCTGNSARSILAEHLLRTMAPERFEVHSAGSSPTGEVHSLARRVLEERYGVDTSEARSKPVSEVQRIQFDLVITVCDAARDACPVWLGAGAQVHWGLEDPARVEGSEEERLQAFRSTALRLERRLELLLALPPGELDRLRLEAVHRDADGDAPGESA